MARKMKDSSIAWIGNIPVDWKLERLKWILSERKEKNAPLKTDFILSLGAAYGVIPYAEKEGGGNKAKESLTDYRLAYPNDIVMNSMNIISGSVGISKYFGCVSPVYYTLYPHNSEDSAEYYCYLFQTIAFQRSLLGLGNGILMKESASGNFNTVRMRIPMEKLGTQLLPLPSSNEQKKIATFLDTECARIDAVIEQTRASIEEYKKLKQAIITQAVTKGIRPGRKMKDSGIEWIGEVPFEWEVKRTKYFSDSFSKGSGITKEDVIKDGQIPCVRYGEIYTKFNQSFEYCVSYTELDRIASPQFFSNGDILFTCTGELIEEIGKCIAYIGDEECLAGGDIIVMKHSQNPSFMSYVLNSNYAQAQKSCGKTKLKVVHVSAAEIKNVVIAVPSLDEQKEIADYLDKKCAGINALIEDKDRLITELEKYKKSLIFEYVTGKKEVPA